MKIKAEYRLKLIGKQIADYQIQEKIWQGATSTVYKAQGPGENVPYGTFVAMKVLHPYRTLSSQKKQFIREAKISMKLNHPNLVKSYKLRRENNLLFIIMEYIDGKSLRQHLTERDVSPKELVYALWETGKALTYLHEKGMVHRDVKPENIIVSNDFEKVKLADLGCSKMLRKTWGRKDPVVGGTEKYMAPEQKKGNSDQRADIYSFGILMGELLTGTVDRAKDFLANVIQKATQSFPPQRYQAMSQLMEDLKPVVDAYL